MAKHQSKVKANTIEAWLEAELVARVRAAGGICEKVTVIGRRGFFDRLIVLPGGRVIFAEVKKPKGSRISPHQRDRHTSYRSLGATVVIVKNLADIDALILSS
jgi:hypothetical protein